jgi:KipI family sensor histidine kinase inhibitor
MPRGLFERAAFRIAGDRGLLVEYGNEIDPEVNSKVRAMAVLMQENRPEGVIEIIPTYRSLLVVYDPAVMGIDDLKKNLITMEDRLGEVDIPPPDTVEIPVCYGEDYGPDIQFVADCHDLSVDDVVRIHSAPAYQIYMIGFTPGFPFLGGLPETLHTPRLETPRSHVPAGSVGIANNQTGIYPVDSPGGWQLIGRTPLKLFEPRKANPFLYKAGDKIRFKPISRREYDRMDGEGR